MRGIWKTWFLFSFGLQSSIINLLVFRNFLLVCMFNQYLVKLVSFAECWQFRQDKYNITWSVKLLTLIEVYETFKGEKSLLIEKPFIMWNMSLKWIIGVLWMNKTFGSEVVTVNPQKRSVMVLNRWWYISGNYQHFIGARVANFTCVFPNDQREQAIIMSSLIHWSDLLFTLTLAL